MVVRAESEAEVQKSGGSTGQGEAVEKADLQFTLHMCSWRCLWALHTLLLGLVVGYGMTI